jgi:Transposase DDE domain
LLEQKKCGITLGKVVDLQTMKQPPQLSSLHFDILMSELSDDFSSLPDHRSERRQYSLDDTIKSAFAMFSLKSLSLLNFRERTRTEDGNLQRVYRITEIPSDTQMRSILDEVKSSSLDYAFVEVYAHLHASSLLNAYRLPCAKNALIVSVDGVEHFIFNEGVLPMLHGQNPRRWHDKLSSRCLLCAVIIHPQKADVFPLGLEPIVHQDGSTKNDCERNATKRLVEHLRQNYADESLLFVEDALYANTPHIRQIHQASPHWQYLLAVKPGSHKGLFERFATLQKQSAKRAPASHQHTDVDGTRYRFEYVNNLALCESATDVRVNMLVCTATTKKGVRTTFSWITDIPVTRQNLYGLMKAGRARWKIENETFNTLKNQGYHFEHNYGHGKKNLASVLAAIMLLAFLVDQVQAAVDILFRKVSSALALKMKFWETLRAVFAMKPFDSMSHAFCIVAQMYKIQLE